MNKLMLLSCGLFAAIVIAAETTNSVPATTLISGLPDSVPTSALFPATLTLPPPTAEETIDLMAMMRRQYVADSTSREGRIKWHGKITNEVWIAANSTVIEFYEDGYRHITPPYRAKPARLMSQLEKQANEQTRLARAAAVKERKRQYKLDRIADLTTNLTGCAEIVAARNRYSMELATMLCQDELQKLQAETASEVYGGEIK